MPRVATLIGPSHERRLTGTVADRAVDAIGARALYFLADGVACDIPVPEDVADPRAALQAALGDTGLDVVVQDADTRRKRVLIADMDSTMIRQECIDELAAEVGIGAEVAAITARAMNGELDFETAFRERMALLAGTPFKTVERVLETRITLMPGGEALVATMRGHGAHCALVSGGFTAFTGAIAQRLGFHEHRANTLDVRDGRLTGRAVEPILGREAKVEALHDICAATGCDPSDVIAVGDGANDLGMIARAGTGVALHAKPAVAEAADIRIDHGDLTALLYIQGYRAADVIGHA